ncbi:MAG: alpha/beta fold hydrolase [Anaerolineae bacterium]|nr:alpha/beta fold hydrolase [Anaerolineae bacterium]
MTDRIHQGQPVLRAGVPLEQAKGAVIMIHGRGASAYDILGIAGELALDNFTYLAPQAAGNTWYPNRFVMPLESNEPYLSSALGTVGELVEYLGQQGMPPKKVMLLGFSQGACLALEYAARNATRYGGVVALSGALIGPDGTPRKYPGSLNGTPVFLGCSNVDFHIPEYRVHESTEVMRNLGGAVTEKIYPNMGHTVNADELKHVQEMMAGMVSA